MNLTILKKKHIESAVKKVETFGIPKGRNFRTKALQFNGKPYPTKLVVSWAHEIVNGEEIDTNDSSFTTNVAIKCLTELGYKIIRIDKK